MVTICNIVCHFNLVKTWMVTLDIHVTKINYSLRQSQFIRVHFFQQGFMPENRPVWHNVVKPWDISFVVNLEDFTLTHIFPWTPNGGHGESTRTAFPLLPLFQDSTWTCKIHWLHGDLWSGLLWTAMDSPWTPPTYYLISFNFNFI